MLSNIAFKLGIVFTLGGSALGWLVLRSMLFVIAGVSGALLFA